MIFAPMYCTHSFIAYRRFKRREFSYDAHFAATLLCDRALLWGKLDGNLTRSECGRINPDTSNQAQSRQEEDRSTTPFTYLEKTKMDGDDLSIKDLSICKGYVMAILWSIQCTL